MQIKQLLKGQEGFTFIEMLLVLVITMLICSIGINVGKQYMDRQEENRFMEQLKSDIEMTQALSFQYQTPASFYIYESLREIHIYANGYDMVKPLVIRKYPENIKFNLKSNMDHVLYTENQTVLKAGTIKFTVNGRNKEAIVYIGEGRVRIVQ
ncbi:MULTISPECIES: competence type IV pilus minor pilin ComGD [unclassified Rummeliibacillus]|uniref:competence type IV pilus minor pilin ComGD n=1 Tax=unclassified Rummeliibacillus TaxID=2622809 RepID=UPI000E66AAB7|nr:MULTISPECIES: competence type IV pilus minor pilin ComGD [unclassified Rummeliibacillus]RIJ64004.1 prepilin-type N-terminal cleavage/methylation domain-containing protein [Rummeliibacillus sp. POC4]RPJ94844.1 prepilin-type N-terminal cleavage/methylation domain-containing protein [Rummeliibacillus sp. TYF005]